MFFPIVLFCIELVLHPVSILISIFNFILVLRSALLHTNLKWILLAQSVCICMSELCRFIFMVSKIPAHDIYASPSFVFTFASVYLFANTFRLLLSYLLLAERCVATVLFRHYFKMNAALWFNIPCLVVMLLISYGIQSTQDNSPYEFNDSTLASICVLILLQNVAILLLALIYMHNKKKYQSAHALTLNQRFQLSENIRTMRQLGPTFVLYSVNALLVYGIKFLFIFGWVADDVPQKTAFMVQTLLLAMVNIGIEMTVITHHPLLKRRAIKWILSTVKLCRKNDVSDAQTVPNQKPKNLFGEELIIHSQQQYYFDMLSKAWI